MSPPKQDKGKGPTKPSGDGGDGGDDGNNGNIPPPSFRRRGRSPPRQTNPRPHFEMNKPDPFYGDHHKINDWIYTIQRYTVLHQMADWEAIIFATSFFKGYTQTWWRNLEAEDSLPNNMTLDHFEELLRAQFQPINETEELRDKLANLKQYGKIEGYNAAFTNLTLQISDLSDAEKIDKYKRGLKPEILFEVRQRGLTTLTGIMEAATRYDAMLHQYKQTSFKPTPEYKGRSDHKFEKRSSNYPNKHWNERKSTGKGFNAIGKTLTKEEMAQHCKEGKCFYCHQKGHLSPNCPKKPKKDEKPREDKTLNALSSDTTNNMVLKVKKFHPDAVTPARATDGSAGYDIVLITGAEMPVRAIIEFETGLGFEIPEGYCGELKVRSSIGKKGISLEAGGIIDWDYHGKVKVILRNGGDQERIIRPCSKPVVQLILTKITTPEVKLVTTLSETSCKGGF